MKKYLVELTERFPHNPTNIALRRFERVPWGEMKTMFTEAQGAFGRQMKDAMKTRYDRLWKDD